jgi:hypothetical protein
MAALSAPAQIHVSGAVGPQTQKYKYLNFEKSSTTEETIFRDFTQHYMFTFLCQFFYHRRE